MALLPVMALVLMCALAAMYMICCMSAVPRLPKNCGAVPVAPVAGRASRQPAHPVHVLRCARSAGMPAHHIVPVSGQHAAVVVHSALHTFGPVASCVLQQLAHTVHVLRCTDAIVAKPG